MHSVCVSSFHGMVFDIIFSVTEKETFFLWWWNPLVMQLYCMPPDIYIYYQSCLARSSKDADYFEDLHSRRPCTDELQFSHYIYTTGEKSTRKEKDNLPISLFQSTKSQRTDEKLWVGDGKIYLFILSSRK